MKLPQRLTHGGVSASGVMLDVGRNNCLSQAAIIEDGNMSKYLTLIAAAAVLLAMPPAKAQQADYPNRPIKIVVCLPAGGGVDTVTRIVSDKLQRRLGQPIIIENKGRPATWAPRWSGQQSPTATHYSPRSLRRLPPTQCFTRTYRSTRPNSRRSPS